MQNFMRNLCRTYAELMQNLSGTFAVTPAELLERLRGTYASGSHLRMAATYEWRAFHPSRCVFVCCQVVARLEKYKSRAALILSSAMGPLPLCGQQAGLLKSYNANVPNLPQSSFQ